MLRRDSHSDVPKVAAFYHAIWHETHAVFMPCAEVNRRSISFFQDLMSALVHSTLIDERDGMLAGFSSWTGDLLGPLYVASLHRGSPVAMDLISATEMEMAKDGTLVAELHCVVGNNRARRFYERMGWQHEGDVCERVAGKVGEVDAMFWCMRKPLR